MIKVSVPYAHDPADLTPIYLAVSRRGAQPAEDSWRPAFRDTVDGGRRVVFARFPEETNPSAGVVWLKDRAGARQVVAT